MRKLNTKLLREYLQSQGSLARDNLAVATGISTSKLGRMLNGKRDASKAEMAIICDVTGYRMDDLFPVTESDQAAS